MAEPILITHQTTGVSGPSALGPPVSFAGTITGVRVLMPNGNLSGETQTFDIYVDGVAQTTGLEVPDGDNEDTVSALSIAVTDDNSVQFRIESPIADTLPVPPYHFTIYWTSADELAAASTTEVLTGTATNKAVTPDALAALWEQGSDVASASTISLGEGGYFNITGTTTITDIDFGTTKAGRTVKVKFAGILTLTHHGTNLILPTGANITTAAGDVAEFVSEGGDIVRCTNYQRADGTALAGSGGGDITTDPAWAAKGDLIAATGNDAAAVVTVGSDGTFLKADSGAASGVSWASIPGGGDLLSTNNLNDLVDPDAAIANLGITSTAAELNLLDGVTASTAELNILDGVTATASELNALDGITATVTELNYTDGVTSAIQTQLDAKAPKVNPQLALDASQASDDNYAGITIDGRNAASGGVSQWDAVFINSSSEFALADANGSGTYPAIGLAVAGASGGAGAVVLVRGVARNDSWSWTVGTQIFLSATAGGLTQTAPSTSGDKVQVMGIAISADEMLVNPSPDYYTVT